MSPTPTAEAVWITVRCPCGQSVLADTRGAGNVLIRRYCKGCKTWRVLNCLTGTVSLDDGMQYRASA